MAKEIPKELMIKHFGQIEEAKLDFGDLTLFIGPQASGKSIALQLFKLLNDHIDVIRNLKRQGFDLKNKPQNLLELFFGENMSALWKRESSVCWQGNKVNLDSLIKNNRQFEKEKVFYIPAQRVMTLDNGWPRPFMSFRAGDPYVVKNFSEHLRLLMEAGLGGAGGSLFPQDRRLKKILRNTLDQAIFHGASLELDTSQLQRRIILKAGEQQLSFMTWSAGQREFMPLLLGLYWLLPPSAISKKPDIDWVIIEEPEMGLHPQAILSLILIAMELIWRGYRLIISTHSPVIPQAIWAIHNVKELHGKADHLSQIFQIEKSSMTQVFNEILENKTFNSYFFKFKNEAQVLVEDISTLDPWDIDDDVADWGGLTRFSSRVTEVISSLVGERA
jgi:predicted ATPase